MGNWKYKKASYEAATLEFLKIKDDAIKTADERLLGLANYSLALCYSKMEEKEAALEHFKAAAETNDKKIRFRSLFNAGVLHYENQNYLKAAECFKKAILTDNSRIEAKVDFEYAMISQSIKKKRFRTKNENNDEYRETEKEIFQRIKENEQNFFKSSEKTDHEGDGNDY